MKKQIIVVAGGSGSRMQSDLPKQFIPLKGKAILIHTLERMAEVVSIDDIILVLPEQELPRWEKLAIGSPFQNIQIAFGGASRFDSVKSGLQWVDEKALVGVHDSVRPFVSLKTIEACFALAEKKGSGIPSTPLTESIRRVFDGTSRAENRDKYRLVQTPQCFQAAKLKKAYSKQNSPQFTDDASVFEASGQKIFLVEGNPENIKITKPFDLKLAETLI